MALAGSRSADHDHPRAAPGRADSGSRACGGARAAWAAGHRLPPRFHERRVEALFLRPDCPFRAVGGRGRPTGAPMASGGGADLRAGEKDLSVPEAGAGHAHDALRDPRCPAGGPHKARAEWAVEHRLYRTGEFDAAAERGRPHSPHVVDDAGSAATPTPSGVVASVLSLRAAAWVAPGAAFSTKSTGRQASTATLPPPDSGDGRRPNESPVERS